jgi:hypothetical protein
MPHTNWASFKNKIVASEKKTLSKKGGLLISTVTNYWGRRTNDDVRQEMKIHVRISLVLDLGFVGGVDTVAVV